MARWKERSMSLLFVLQLFASTATPLARSVALAALRITVGVVASDLTGGATDGWTNALLHLKVLVLLRDPCANHCILKDRRLVRLLVSALAWRCVDYPRCSGIERFV